jgi:5'-deoxynucleotidase YfbR-like HD superfamily hydrolase
MMTYTGRQVKPLAITEEMIHILDIAHALSRINRYNGHLAGTMSVAEHSVNVSRLMPEGDLLLRMTALFHDAPEAYLGDIIRPLKMLPQMAFYKEAEQRIYSVMARKFGLIDPIPREIKEADNAILEHELSVRRDPLLGLMADDAELLFLQEYLLLTT